jgi:hypothetical protein
MINSFIRKNLLDPILLLLEKEILMQKTNLFALIHKKDVSLQTNYF